MKKSTPFVILGVLLLGIFIGYLALPHEAEAQIIQVGGDFTGGGGETKGIETEIINEPKSWRRIIVDTEIGYNLKPNMASVQVSTPQKWLKFNGTFQTDFPSNGTANETGTKYFGFSINETLNGGYLCWRNRGSSDTPTCKYPADFTSYTGTKYGFNHIYYTSWANIPDGLDMEFQLKVECDSCIGYPEQALIYFGSGTTAITIVGGTNIAFNGSTNDDLDGWAGLWSATSGTITISEPLTMNGFRITDDSTAGTTAWGTVSYSGGQHFSSSETGNTTNTTSPAYLQLVGTNLYDGVVEHAFETTLGSNIIYHNVTHDGVNPYHWEHTIDLDADFIACGDNSTDWTTTNANKAGLYCLSGNLDNIGSIVIRHDTEDFMQVLVMSNATNPEYGGNYIYEAANNIAQLHIGFGAAAYGSADDMEVYVVVVDGANYDLLHDGQAVAVEYENMLYRYPSTINITEGAVVRDIPIHIKTTNANISSDFYIEDNNNPAAQGYNRTFLIQTTANQSDVYVELDGTELHFGSNDLITYATNDTLPSGTAFLEVVSMANYAGQDIIGKFNFTNTSTRIRTLNESLSGFPPTFDQTPTNQAITVGETFNYTVNVTDGTGVDVISINDTTNFDLILSGTSGDLSRSGTINSSALSAGEYSLNISANDTSGNTNSIVITITVGISCHINSDTLLSANFNCNGKTLNITEDATLHTAGFRIDSADMVVNGTLNATHGNAVVNNTGDVTVRGNFTFNTTGTAGVWHGSLTIPAGGAYNATNGTTTITSESGSYGLYSLAGSTFIHNSGTFNFTGTATPYIRTQGGNLYNTILSNNARFVLSTTIENDLTVVEGVTQMTAAAYGLTVTGDVIVEDGGTLGVITQTAANSFGSLTINSGGTYSATSGTTTITSETTGNRIIETVSGATFTHNNGLVNITTSSSAQQIDMTGTEGFYNLEISGGSSDIRWRDPKPFQIANNLMLSGSSDFETGSTSAGLNVSGDVIIGDGCNLGFGVNTWIADAWMGSLTINSGGTYSATSGTTTISGNFDNDGTFTHNDGMVNFTLSAAANVNGTEDITFFDVSIVNSAGANVQQKRNVTIIGALLGVGGNDYWLIDSNVENKDIALTMGNSTSAGTITLNSDHLNVNGDTTYSAKVYGASQLYPVVISNDANWDRGGSGSNVAIKWIDLQDTDTSDGTGVTITLEGDVEFDAFTVSSGDTLNLNGQRAEFSGLLNIQGTLIG